VDRFRRQPTRSAHASKATLACALGQCVWMKLALAGVRAFRTGSPAAARRSLRARCRKDCTRTRLLQSRATALQYGFQPGDRARWVEQSHPAARWPDRGKVASCAESRDSPATTATTSPSGAGTRRRSSATSVRRKTWEIAVKNGEAIHHGSDLPIVRRSAPVDRDDFTRDIARAGEQRKTTRPRNHRCSDAAEQNLLSRSAPANRPRAIPSRPRSTACGSSQERCHSRECR